LNRALRQARDAEVEASVIEQYEALLDAAKTTLVAAAQGSTRFAMALRARAIARRKRVAATAVLAQERQEAREAIEALKSTRSSVLATVAVEELSEAIAQAKLVSTAKYRIETSADEALLAQLTSLVQRQSKALAQLADIQRQVRTAMEPEGMRETGQPALEDLARATAAEIDEAVIRYAPEEVLEEARTVFDELRTRVASRAAAMSRLESLKKRAEDLDEDALHDADQTKFLPRLKKEIDAASDALVEHRVVRAAKKAHGRAITEVALGKATHAVRRDVPAMKDLSDTAPLQAKLENLRAAMGNTVGLMEAEGVDGWKPYEDARVQADRAEKAIQAFHGAEVRLAAALAALKSLDVVLNDPGAAAEDKAKLSAAVMELEEALDDARDFGLDRKIITDAQVIMTNTRSRWKEVHRRLREIVSAGRKESEKAL